MPRWNVTVWCRSRKHESLQQRMGDLPLERCSHELYRGRKLKEKETAVQNVVLLVPVKEQAARLNAELKESKASELPAALQNPEVLARISSVFTQDRLSDPSQTLPVEVSLRISAIVTVGYTAINTQTIDNRSFVYLLEGLP